MSTPTVSQVILPQRIHSEPITLPPLFCPFTAAINPHMEDAHAHALAWAIEFQLVQPQSKQLARLGGARLAWFAARANPRLNRDQLALITDWLIWLICYDDLCDAAAIGRDPAAWRTLTTRFLVVIQAETHLDQTEPLARALADLCRRLRQQTSTGWLARFADNVSQTFQANRWETLIHASSATPDLATYTKMRLLTSAIVPCFDLVAISAGVDLHASWLGHAYIKQLTWLAGNHISWVNDLFGLAKEIKENNQNNLVLVLQHEFQLPLQAAVDRTVALCNAEMKAFLALTTLLATEEWAIEPDCQCYIDSLQGWMRGNLDWYAQTERYQPKPVAGEALAEGAPITHPVKHQTQVPYQALLTSAVENPSHPPSTWNYAVLRDDLLALS